MNEHNQGRLPQCVSDPHQYCLVANCRPGRQHYSTTVEAQTVKRALQQHGEIKCPTCSPTQVTIIRHVAPVEGALEKTRLLCIREVRWLRGTFSSVDFLLPDLNVAVHVDGCRHTHTDVLCESLAEQQLTDWRFDNKCVRQGKRALRIHYKDSMQPTAAFQAAVYLCILYLNIPS